MAVVDFGRKAYIDLMVSKDPAIGRLIDEGYEFVTNAFTPAAKPPGVQIKDAETVTSELRRQGYLIELRAAYNEVGDPISQMQSVWCRRRGAPKP
ncbi:MAG: hypothetical protein HY278_06060 [candidate division NC10 bacterium]|nr:hypothetical protein [candidate division NC10 bacterium]